MFPGILEIFQDFIVADFGGKFLVPRDSNGLAFKEDSTVLFFCDFGRFFRFFGDLSRICEMLGFWDYFSFNKLGKILESFQDFCVRSLSVNFTDRYIKFYAVEVNEIFSSLLPDDASLSSLFKLNKTRF